MKPIKIFTKDANEENGRHKFTRNDTTVSVDSSIIREQNKEAGHTSSQGFITMLDSQGNIKEVGLSGSRTKRQGTPAARGSLPCWIVRGISRR